MFTYHYKKSRFYNFKMNFVFGNVKIRNVSLIFFFLICSPKVMWTSKLVKAKKSTLTISRISMHVDDGNIPWKSCLSVTNYPGLNKNSAWKLIRLKLLSNPKPLSPITPPEKLPRWVNTKQKQSRSWRGTARHPQNKHQANCVNGSKKKGLYFNIVDNITPGTICIRDSRHTIYISKVVSMLMGKWRKSCACAFWQNNTKTSKNLRLSFHCLNYYRRYIR